MNQKDLRDLSAVYDRILQENVYDQQKSRFDSDISNKFADKAGHSFSRNYEPDQFGRTITDERVIDQIQRSIDSGSGNNQEPINLKEILDNPSVAEKFVRLVKFYVATTKKSGNPPREDLIKIDLAKVSYGLKNDQIADAIHSYVNATKDGETNWKSYQ
jgi:hypothetical protein